MKTNTKIFIIILIFSALLLILNGPIDEHIGTFTKLGLLSIGVRVCCMIIGAAVGFRFCLDSERKKNLKLAEKKRENLVEGNGTLYVKGIRKVYNSNFLSARIDIGEASKIAFIAGYKAMTFNGCIHLILDDGSWEKTPFLLTDFEC